MSRSRKALLSLLAIAAIVPVPAAFAGGDYGDDKDKDKDKDKVTICHRTGSESNPFVLITVSRNALPAHKAHGDRFPKDGKCKKDDKDKDKDKDHSY